MKKMSRDQKRKMKKQRELKRKQKKKLNKKLKPKPWQPVKGKFVITPPLFKENVPFEEKVKVIRQISQQAQKDFEDKYPQLEQWFKEYDALYILSFCAFYFTSSPEGIDPETSGKLDFPFHFLEILQAFSLIQKRNLTPKPLREKSSVLLEEMRELGDLMVLRMVGTPEAVKDEDSIPALRLRNEMQGQTLAVRNWAYLHQMKHICLDLAEKVDKQFLEMYGTKATLFIKLVFSLIEEMETSLNDHLGKIRSFYKQKTFQKVFDAYQKAFPENIILNEKQKQDIWEKSGKKLSSLKAMLLFHSDLRLQDIFTINLDRIMEISGEPASREKIKALLDNLSYSFGDLKDQNKEYILLNNPVHHKPFIKVDENTYYSSIWGILPHLLLNILEDLIYIDDDFKKIYSNSIKSKYLEDRVEEIFKNGFPSAKIFRGNLWKSDDGKTYENDLLVIIDTFAIIVEEKSGLISPQAKRGAPLDLFETLKRLIEEPSEQALRFIEYLQKQGDSVSLQTTHGKNNTIDLRTTKYFIPLGVTFNHLGMISSNLKKLIDAKVVDKKLEDLAPSISFTDLECIFHLLPLESQKIHYLARRREFEAHMLYEGDELDLLSFYLDNGFNIGETEYSRDMIFHLGLKSKELDPYFVGTNEGIKMKKPELEMTQWWKDLLKKLSTKKSDGWLEASYVLLNTTKEDQEKFESKFFELIANIKAGKVEKPHNWVMFLSGPSRRTFAIAGYPYVTKNKELRNNIMSQALDEPRVEKARGAVAIGVDIKQPTYPYTVFATRMSTNLFDELTIEQNEKVG